MQPRQFSDLMAQIVLAFIVAIVLFTAFGFWLKLFWWGWVIS